MSDYNATMKRIINEVKAEYEKQEFATVYYPSAINRENWYHHANNIEIPLLHGCLYFIFVNNKNEEKKLLYIGKSISLGFALRNHLSIRTSPTTSSILPTIQEFISRTKDKRVFIKVLDIEPVELCGAIKPYLIKHYEPSLSKRLS